MSASCPCGCGSGFFTIDGKTKIIVHLLQPVFRIALLGLAA